MHPLALEAVDMGYTSDHASAALISFRGQVTGGAMEQLCPANHLNDFINFLVEHPEEEFCGPGPAVHTTAQQQQQQRYSQDRKSKDRNEHGLQEEDLQDHGFSDGGEYQQPAVVPAQQHRKRLKRSCESAQATELVCASASGESLSRQQQPCRMRQQQHASADQYLSTTAARQTCSREALDENYIVVEQPSNSVAAATAKAGRIRICSNSQLRRPGRTSNEGPSVSKSSAKHDDKQAKLSMFFVAQQQPQPQQQHIQQQQQATRRPSGISESLDHAKTPAAASNKQSVRAAASSLSQQQHQDPARKLSPLRVSQVGRAGATAASGNPAAFKAPSAFGQRQQQRTLASAASALNAAGLLGSTTQQGGATQQCSYPPQQCLAAPWLSALSPAEAGLDRYELVNLKVFGHKQFRPQQKEIVMQAVNGRDLFVLMPTGGGKSLCYQLPAVICKGVTVVVCPLLSLMQDQVHALCVNPLGGVPASFLSSQQTETERRAVKNELCKGVPSLKLLYVTPEQLVQSDSLRNILQKLMQRGRLARFVIDEAHCVSTWGHDFRPDYKGLGILRAQFLNVPITAVTATATSKVQDDILSILRISRTVSRHKTSFLRPNLLFKVVPKVRDQDEDGHALYMTNLIKYIKQQQVQAAAAGRPAVKIEGGSTASASGTAEASVSGTSGSTACGTSSGTCSGIIYCLSRKEAEELAKYLRVHGGVEVGHYHAGMTPKQRMQVQNAFFAGQLSVIVATIAFGMGIDKPDVRFVVHFCVSGSLEGYYQEAGRAGRDGLPAECVLMFSAYDCNRMAFMLRQKNRGSKASQKLQNALDKLELMKGYAMDSKQCRHKQLLDYFGVASSDLQSGTCGHSCDVCRGEVIPLNPEDWDAGDNDRTSHDNVDLLSDIEEYEDGYDEEAMEYDGDAAGAAGHQQYNSADCQQQPRGGVGVDALFQEASALDRTVKQEAAARQRLAAEAEPGHSKRKQPANVAAAAASEYRCAGDDGGAASIDLCSSSSGSSDNNADSAGSQSTGDNSSGECSGSEDTTCCSSGSGSESAGGNVSRDLGWRRQHSSHSRQRSSGHTSKDLQGQAQQQQQKQQKTDSGLQQQWQQVRQQSGQGHCGVHNQLPVVSDSEHSGGQAEQNTLPIQSGSFARPKRKPKSMEAAAPPHQQRVKQHSQQKHCRIRQHQQQQRPQGGRRQQPIEQNGDSLGPRSMQAAAAGATCVSGAVVGLNIVRSVNPRLVARPKMLPQQRQQQGQECQDKPALCFMSATSLLSMPYPTCTDPSHNAAAAAPPGGTSMNGGWRTNGRLKASAGQAAGAKHIPAAVKNSKSSRVGPATALSRAMQAIDDSEDEYM